MQTLLVTATLTLLLCFVSCLSPPQERSGLRVKANPFSLAPAHSAESLGAVRSSPETTKASSRFCLAKMENDFELPDAEERLAAFEDLVAAELTEVGFGVVRSGVFDPTWEATYEATGPIFDAMTGVPLEGRREAARQEAMEAIEVAHGCGFRLEAGIQIVSVPWIAGEATWDGLTDVDESSWASGAVFMRAMSLHVNVYDRSGALVYFGAGGIQLIARYRPSFGDKPFVPVDEGLLLTNEDWNRDSIEISLEGLIELAQSGG